MMMQTIETRGAQPCPPPSDRHWRGTTGYHAGISAEAAVERDYRRRGRPVVGRRWRGSSGEIDLIARDGDGYVFIEVKASRSHARAAERLSRRQMARIYASASEYLATTPLGQDSEVRFDVALVDGTGAIEIIENAFGMF